MLSNLFAGDFASTRRRIVFPLLPEYLGYADQGLSEQMFSGCRPRVVKRAEHEFYYDIDFERLQLDAESAALCVSSPANPTGKVLSVNEFSGLKNLAAAQNIPLIVDLAYGLPFPGIVHGEARVLPWSEECIFVLSLSKLGMPGARTGIVIAAAPVVERLTRMNTILSLANGNLGPVLLDALLTNNELDDMCRQVIQPFYRERKDTALRLLQEHLGDLPWRVHRAEGAFFLWLWLEGLPISSGELYERLKRRNVLVMDGSHFFFAEKAVWPHANECLRISYCRDDETLRQAIEILADEIRVVYGAQ